MSAAFVVYNLVDSNLVDSNRFIFMIDEALQREAAHEQTAPERLRKIHDSAPSVPVLRAVAQNPNTPTGILWQLAPKFPREVIDNPVLPLLHLENSDIGNTISEAAALGFLCLDNLPLWMLDAFEHGPLSRNARIENTLKLHWQSSKTAGQNWESGVQATVSEQAVEIVTRLSRAWSYAEAAPLERALRLRLVPDWLAAPLMEALQQIPHAQTGVSPSQRANNVAGLQFVNEELPSPRETEDSSTNDSSESVATGALQAFKQMREAKQATFYANYHFQDPNISEQELERLAEKNAVARRRLIELRREQACDANASPETLRFLANSEARAVVVVVARHPNTPQETLELLASDKDAWVRGALARNERLSAGLLRRLAADEHCIVRANVARHPKTKFSILRQLAGDEDGEVLDALAHRRDLPAKLAVLMARRRSEVASWGSSRPPGQMARDPQTPAAVLKKLAGDTDKIVRRHVARHPKTPVETLRLLAADPNDTVRARVAENRATPPDILLTLSMESALDVQTNAAGNPGTPLSRLLQMIEEVSEAPLPRYMALVSNATLPLFALEKLLEKVREVIETAASKLAWWAPVPQPQYGHRMTPFRDEKRTDEFFEALLSHPNATPDLRRRARALRRREISLAFAVSDNLFERAITLGCAQTPIEVLEGNLYAPNWIWRLAIARNPATPDALLQTLARDGNRYVRACIAERLQRRNSQHDTA